MRPLSVLDVDVVRSCGRAVGKHEAPSRALAVASVAAHLSSPPSSR
jgi:hypothetical protein